MSELVSVVLADTIGAAILGLLAALAWRVGRSAPMAHGLALLALIKLITPPLFDLPLVIDTGTEPVAAELVELVPLAGTAIPEAAPAFELPTLAETLLGIWILGTAVTLWLLVRRVRRFGRLLAFTDPAPAAVHDMVASLSGDLGIRRTPRVVVVDARISPNLFALARRPVIVLPRMLVDALEPAELRAVLAHELCHLANHDHRTRWLECVVAALHWWNPIAHCVRRLLREVEELRCDARAVELLQTSARSYGRTILRATEFIEPAPHALPLGASGLGGAQSFRRRLTMIAQRRLTHRLAWPSKLTLALGAGCLLPLGVTAQEEHRIEIEVQDSKEEIGKLLERVEKMLDRISARVGGEKRVRFAPGKSARGVYVLGKNKLSRGGNDAVTVKIDGDRVVRLSRPDQGKGKGKGNALRWVEKDGDNLVVKHLKDGEHIAIVRGDGKGKDHGHIIVRTSKGQVTHVEPGKYAIRALKGDDAKRGVWVAKAGDEKHGVWVKGSDRGRGLWVAKAGDKEHDVFVRKLGGGEKEHGIWVAKAGAKDNDVFVRKLGDGEHGMFVRRAKGKDGGNARAFVRKKKKGNEKADNPFFIRKGSIRKGSIRKGSIRKDDSKREVIRVRGDAPVRWRSAKKKSGSSDVESLRRRVRKLEQQLRELKKAIGRSDS